MRAFSPNAGSPLSVREQLLEGVFALKKRGVSQIAAYFQPNTNTYAPVERLKALWDEAAAVEAVKVLCVGTRPDVVPDEVLDLLSSYRERFREIWLELGLQSANDETLRIIGRGHDAHAFADACKRAKARGLLVAAHVILGLPGEGPEDEAVTAKFLARCGVDGVKLHQLSIVEGTAMELIWQNGGVEALSEEKYADRAAAFIKLLPKKTIIHRLVGDTLGEKLLAPKFNKASVEHRIRAAL